MDEHPEYSISDIRKIFPFGEVAIRSWLKVGKTLESSLPRTLLSNINILNFQR